MCRELTCTVCHKDLGVVRDGKLSKGLTTLCSSCFNKMQIHATNWIKQEMQENTLNKKKHKWSDPKADSKDKTNLGDLFGNIWD